MKRCPECDFLYEDDQRLCDMDGIALVHDARAFPENSPILESHASKHLWQRFAIALPLTVLAGLAFYVLQHQPTAQMNHPAAVVITSETESPTSAAGQPQSSSLTPPSSSVQAAGALESRSATEEKVNPSNEVPGAAKSETGPGEADGTNSKEEPEATSPPTSKSTVKPVRSPGRTKYSSGSQKDSKLTSFLKKTGRILKKPFTR